MLAAALLLFASSPVFLDRTQALGLAIGGDGACWADFDGDGWPDLCAGGAAWRNEKGVRFAKIADTGPSVAADFDNDGKVDLFSWSPPRLWRNTGDGFEQSPLPELPKTVSRGACWGDFNGDGFVDLYMGGYEGSNPGVTYPDVLLLNRGGKAFEAAWTDATGRARGVTACDFDRNGTLDVYVSNYRLMPNRLWLNDGRGAFLDAAPARNAIATSEGFGGGHSIGACWADFDNDGQFDLFAGNFAHVDSRGDQPKSRFLRNLGPTGGFAFEDRGTCGVFYQESYASPAAGDYDNDGDLDLLFTTVYATASFGRKNHPVLYRNNSAFMFSDETGAAGVSLLGPTYQAAWADFDRDGDLDVVTDGKLFVNLGTPNQWIGVRLVGDGKQVNRSAIGAQVRIRLGEATLTRQVEAGTGEGNQNDLTLHFGLGAHRGPVDLEVLWPNQRVQTVRGAHPGTITDVRFR